MFRRRQPQWVCAWQSTGFHATTANHWGARFARHGYGETHAVATDGTQSEAICGQIVRFVGKDPWPPSFGDECVDCARISSGGSLLPPTTPVSPPVRKYGFAPELFPVELHGRSVRLEPLASGHAADLLAAASEDRSSFTYVDVPSDLPQMRTYIEKLSADRVAGKGLPFAVYDMPTARAVGVTCYLNVEWSRDPSSAEHTNTPNFLEIGRTWLAASVQRTHVNTESKLLMLNYAFEHLGVGRVSLHADEEDVRARVAILRLGAWFEGIRRGHAIGADGTMRNSAYFSITAVEWPAIKEVLSERLGRR